jgi:hypothetical protein
VHEAAISFSCPHRTCVCTGDASVDVTSELVMDAAADTLRLSGPLIANVGTAQRSSASDKSEPGLVLSVAL